LIEQLHCGYIQPNVGPWPAMTHAIQANYSMKSREMSGGVAFRRLF